MAKCGTCGRFLSSSDAATCCSCKVNHHRGCVGFPEGARLPCNWVCSTCKVKPPRQACTQSVPVTPAYTKTHSQKTSSIDADDVNIVTPTNKSELGEFLVEMRRLRDEMTALRAELGECRMEIAGFRSSMENLTVRVDAIDERVLSLEKRIEETTLSHSCEAIIQDLKSQINDRDQEILMNDIEISGVPEVRGENIIHLITMATKKLGVTLEERDIVSAERVGVVRRNRPDGESEERPRLVVVRLARRAVRDDMLSAARVRRGVTTEGLGLPGQACRFYLNERLTRPNRQLFAKARELGRRYKWKFIWTKSGRIFARKDDNSHIERVRFLPDLERVFGSGNV